MRWLATIVLVALSFSTPLADFTVKVASAADGYTVTVLRDGSEQVKVRLDGIAAPEKGQPCYAPTIRYSAAPKSLSQ